MKTEYIAKFTVEVELPMRAYSKDDAARIVEEACEINWEKFKLISLDIEGKNDD